MIPKIFRQFENMALHSNPQRAVRLLGALLPPSAIDAMQRARFRQTLRLAARSKFYREEFKRRGIDVKKIEHPSQLGDFYTTGEDLRKHGAEAFLTGKPDTAFETTGTTSPVPKRAYFSNEEIAGMGRTSAIMLRLLGLTKDDRVLSAFDCSFWVSPVVLRSALQNIKCFHVEAGKIPPDEFYERARAYRPTVIFGEPSWMVRLAEIVEKRGAWDVKFLFAGGENITEEARAEVERIWRAPLYLNYGQTESFGAIGSECRAKAGYHRNDFAFFLEIDDADGEGYGELVYTTLTRRTMPLIRYRSNDVLRLIDEPCPCGLFAKRISKIRARCDEMVVCGMGNVGPWVFAELLRDLPQASAEWQVVLRHNGRRDVLDFYIELEDAEQQAEVERRVLENLRARFGDFWKNREMHLFELNVIAAPRGSLRTGRKLKRIVDERQMLIRRAS
jgi:phenylacetate-CoA ligase